MSVITIARQLGSGGKTMGEIIAKKLGYTFIDTEIVRMVSKHARVSPDWVKSIEQDAGGALLKFIDGLVARNFLERMLDDKRGYIDNDIYVDSLYKVMSQLAKEGNCVILGRAGQYILKDYEDVYHLLLVAEKEDRMKFMEKKYNIAHPKAKNLIVKYDKRRRNLYKCFGKYDYDKPTDYHLVLNMSRVDIDKASDIVCRLVAE